MTPAGRALATFAAAALACSCATRPALPPLDPDLPPSVRLDVPFHAQRTDQCGPAALAMVLAASGLDVSPDELVREVYLPGRRGSLQSDLVAAARRRGRLTVPLHGLEPLLGELGAGHPVLVLQDRGLPIHRVWHYAVAIGYELDSGTLLLHSGSEPDRRESVRGFLRGWSAADQWGLVVLAPGELPRAADQDAVLEAIVGLERAGRFAEARRSYVAATGRWPGSLVAWLGLGNAAYQEGDLPGAESALRQTIALHADAAPAWNNLAVVLLDQGRSAEALVAAERAVALGGAHATQYAETLATVRAAREGGTR